MKLTKYVVKCNSCKGQAVLDITDNPTRSTNGLRIINTEPVDRCDNCEGRGYFPVFELEKGDKL